jgi:hypothetical protein
VRLRAALLGGALAAAFISAAGWGLATHQGAVAYSSAGTAVTVVVLTGLRMFSRRTGPEGGLKIDTLPKLVGVVALMVAALVVVFLTSSVISGRTTAFIDTGIFTALLVVAAVIGVYRLRRRKVAS